MNHRPLYLAAQGFYVFTKINKHMDCRYTE